MAGAERTLNTGPSQPSGPAEREPASLRAARDHLAQAEQGFQTVDGLHHLEEGLALLDEVMHQELFDSYRLTAGNIGATYAGKIYTRIRQLIDHDAGVPEPLLEQLFKVLLAFDVRAVDLPPGADQLKVDIVERLIEAYYEGHPEQEKARAREALMMLKR